MVAGRWSPEDGSNAMTTSSPVNPMSQSENDEAAWRLLLDHVANGCVPIEDAIAEIADADGVHAIARLIAPRLEVDIDAVVWALDAESDGPATVLCRAATLNINVFSAVLRMRRRRRCSDMSPPEALNVFRQLSVEAARRILRAARSRPGR
jgi:hypothetical protein